MNKIGSEKVAGSGGIIVLLGFLIGVFVFIAYRTFYLKSNDFLILLLSLLLVVLLSSLIGFIDDLFGWQKGGLSIFSRLILLLFASIPLIAINAGKSTMSIPFYGNLDFGYFYPLFLIPLGIVGATSTFNFLAGFNGLEAGNGIIIISSLAALSYFLGNSWLAIVSICLVASLFAFLIFNFYPAKVFPGNVLTYLIGSFIASISIIGNFEKIAVFFFIPVILEVFLKCRGKLQKQSFGKPNPDGSLSQRYDRFYSLNHIAIYLLEKLNIKPTEKRAVLLIWFFQILIILIGFLIFKQGIFG
ncbi:MAG: glycosyl transferase family 4 [Candidatus Pacearchaeota archaeon]|nr:glycosyl transferase family 4 [Candidatus Pacearchaeota archaeon]